MSERQSTQISTHLMVQKFKALEEECDGDLARMFERLLLENHILSLQTSSGFLRSAGVDFNSFPRFIELYPADDLKE